MGNRLGEASLRLLSLTLLAWVSGCAADREAAVVLAVCGNQVCEPTELPSTCPADCPFGVKGNRLCEAGEDSVNDPSDCAGTVTAVTVGSAFACALRKDQTVWCWGSNGGGALGCGEDPNLYRYSADPLPVKGLPLAVAVSAGAHHACALHPDGAVSCWGDLNDTGNPNPAPVQGLPPVKAISAGAQVTCAVARDGSPWCWGENGFGALGASTPDHFSSTPVQVVGLTEVTSIRAGRMWSCAVRSDGRPFCWGDNHEGALGSKQLAYHSQSLAVPVDGLQSVQALAGNRDDDITRTCALKTDGTVWCWSAWSMVGGTGCSVQERPGPTQIPGLSSVTSFDAGNRYGCVLRNDATVACWGYDNVGPGKWVYCPLPPEEKSDIQDVIQIAVGGSNAPQVCALRADATVWCWIASFAPLPVRVPGL